MSSQVSSVGRTNAADHAQQAQKNQANLNKQQQTNAQQKTAAAAEDKVTLSKNQDVDHDGDSR